MGQLSMELILNHVRFRYKRAKRAEKTKILDEFCAISHFHRKHAIRLLNGSEHTTREKVGRKKHYSDPKLLEVLKQVWLATDQLCGKRLKPALPYWLSHYEKHYGIIPEQVKEDLLVISAASIDRLLRPFRSGNRRRLSGTKPGSLLKKQIPIKTDQWNEKTPGFVEADTVAHCGLSLQGDFVWSLTLTDICTAWTENRAVWNKGAEGVVSQIRDIESHLPFELLGFDSDNGSEFLNYHLLRYFQEERYKQVQYTRSRPYHKDDNAHVEQKNWSHVRRVFGYDRFDNRKIVTLMNDLYKNELSLLQNFFYPTIKLKEKVRVNAKIKKTYEKTPKTPYERVLESKAISLEKKAQLTEQFLQLDPFVLNKRIEEKLKKIFHLVKIQTNKRRANI